MVQAEVIKNARDYSIDSPTAYEVPFTPIQGRAEIVDDPSVSALGLITTPLVWKVPLVGLPTSVNRLRPAIRESATTLESGRVIARLAASVRA